MRATVLSSDISGSTIQPDDHAQLTVTDPDDERKVWVLDITKEEAKQFVGKGKLKGRPGRPKGKVT